ncbi:MAG: mycofactocin biosynthesis glycosyltransferase MftF [Acidimicrobiales bacterium]
MGTTARLPAGFSLALDASVLRPAPLVLVGGAPLRVLRLRPAGGRLVDAWTAGQAVGPGPGEQALARRLLDAGIAHPRPGGGAGWKPGDVTVVVPVRDDHGGLARTLAALGSGPRVVVVDDGSRAPVRASGAELERRERSQGPAGARNAGSRRVATDVVAFVDAGCEPEAGWLTPLLAHLADPAVGAVAPRIRSKAPAGTPGWLATYELLRSPLDLGGHESPVRPGATVPYVPTAALVVRRQALLDAGGFDDSLRFGEDVDFVWRLARRGWRVRYEPAASVSHPARSDAPAWLRQRFEYGLSAALLAARHGRDVAPLAASPWSVAAWLLVLSGRPWTGAALAAGTGAALARRAGGDRSTAVVLAKLAARGNLGAAASLASAVRRAWLPPAVVTAAATRPAGTRALAAALTVPAVAEWVERRPGMGPLPWTALRLADDLAYQAGVWAGAVRARSAACLLPRW